MEDLVSKVDMLSKTYVDPAAPSLNDEETIAATASLSKPFFSTVVRARNDPRISGQEIGLFSFTPSDGARPDKNGIYGVAKLRGNYANAREAANAAELIVRNFDSRNEIYHVRVGEMFPITKEPKWTEKFDSIDLKKKVDDIQRIKERSAEEEEEKERRELLRREELIHKQNKEILEGKHTGPDREELYITAQVGRAQLKWSAADLERKLEEEIRPGIAKREEIIKKMDEEDPSLRERFLEKYMQSRKEACLSNEIPEDHEKVQQGFLKYLVEDI
jgi:hypothetical protein